MRGLLLTLIFLARTVLPLQHSIHPNPSSRRLLHNGFMNEQMKLSYSVNEPPKANKVTHEMKMFGDVRIDNYYWLRDDSRSDPNVLEYLQEENNYTDFMMSGTKYFQDEIYAEIKGRIKGDDITTPRRRGHYYYYERNLAGKEYVQYCRCLALNNGEKPSVYDVMPTGPGSPPEYVILDENLEAQGHVYYKLDAFKVSPNQKLVAYAEDVKGNSIYTVYVIDAETRKPVGKSLVGVTSNVVWAGDEALIYVTMDANLRPEKVWLYKLGKEQTDDLCLYHEKDDIFSVYVVVSESEKFVFVRSASATTSFNLYFDITKPEQGLIPLTPRLDGIDTSVSHRGTHFFIRRRSNEFYNSELLACPVENVSAITVIMHHRESVRIDQMVLFSDHLIVYERENGLTKVNTYNLPPVGEPLQTLQNAQAVEFIDPVYVVIQSDIDFSSSISRFYYSSLRMPGTEFDYDMNTRVSVTKNIEAVLGGFNSTNYITERQWATPSDGIPIPMSIVYRKDLVKLDGSNPLLLYGYGSFEYSEEPFFDASLLSLLDRRFIYAIAHVRGGGEMGRQWYENGRLLKKKNTFTDFIACAEYLIEMKYCTKEKLVIQGEYEGGMLIGAVLNMRPDLFKAAIANVPSVDVLTTMLDYPTFSLTTGQYEEWGDPRKEEFYYYIKSYSPVDNVSSQNYPSILVLSGLNDPYVSYSEPAKFVAKLRDLKTDENILLFKCDFGAAHFAKSGRFALLEEEAFIYTFILKSVNMAG